MSKRLLIIAQRVDESDDLLGFFVSWLREFSRHFDQVSVIALAAGEYDLPGNVLVYSLGKEQGAAKPLQALRAAKLLLRLVPRHDAVFAHMSPIFAILAWPFTFLFHKRLVLWYLHRSDTLRLRIALWLSRVLVTADAGSLTIRSPKIVAVGHGIDAARFTAIRDWSVLGSRPLRIVSVGRLAPIKDFETLIHAAALLKKRGDPVQVRIVGRALQQFHHAYESQLRALVEQLGLQDVVAFVGLVPYREMPEQYRWADVAVGCTPSGGIDKVLLEAMAAGCIVLTSNEVMRKYLEPYADQCTFMHGNAADLADRITKLHDQDAMSRAMIGNVHRYHDLSTTIGKISDLL
jgi:glycosyltransferase involved in cell wall biosynthesis